MLDVTMASLGALVIILSIIGTFNYGRKKDDIVESTLFVLGMYALAILSIINLFT